METNETITTALSALERLQPDANKPAAVIVFPPDSGKYIVGNTDGFVHLAIASLKAAQGETQSFKEVSWVNQVELDWVLRGLEYDDNAHIYLPPTRTLWQRFWSITLPLGLAICLIIGLGTIGYWVVHLYK